MSVFRVVENYDKFFVVDPGGHAIDTLPTEKAANDRIKELEGVVKKRETASKTAKRNSPRK